jgi:hypothetical protein
MRRFVFVVIILLIFGFFGWFIRNSRGFIVDKGI